MKDLKATYILLSADTYSIKDQNTGEINDGLNIWYLTDDVLENQDRDARGNNISKGILPTQGSLPFYCASKLVSVPGMYEVSLRMTTVKQTRNNGTKMAQSIVPVDLKFVGDIKLTVDKPKTGN